MLNLFLGVNPMLYCSPPRGPWQYSKGLLSHLSASIYLASVHATKKRYARNSTCVVTRCIYVPCALNIELKLIVSYRGVSTKRKKQASRKSREKTRLSIEEMHVPWEFHCKNMYVAKEIQSMCWHSQYDFSQLAIYSNPEKSQYIQ